MFYEAVEKVIVACFGGQKYIEGNTVFNSSITNGNNKEYLIAVFKH